MKLFLIAALSRNRVIGRANRLPWDLPADLTNFWQVTAGRPFIMGRRSFESPQALHSSSANIVLSRQEDWAVPRGAVRAGSWAEALRLAAATGAAEVFVLGGEAVFERAITTAERMYLTLVDAEVEGDAYFPVIEWDDWRLLESRRHAADARHAYAFAMNVYERISR